MHSTKCSKAISKKLLCPWRGFYPRGGGENTMRLNFHNTKPDKINEGISRLGVVLKEQIRQNDPVFLSDNLWL